MSLAEPNLVLLLRGELLAMTSLHYDQQRRAMLEALHELLPAYSRSEAGDPGVSLVEALAASLEVMGFYHDRILTESKLGSALLLESVTRLGEVVGYRPRPPLAAVAYQCFIASAQAEVLAGTKVSGKLNPSSASVVFETRTMVTATPAFNRMMLSPLVDRYAGALRIVIRLLNDGSRPALLLTDPSVSSLPLILDEIAHQQNRFTPLPLDDFRPGTLALVHGRHGLELCPVESSRLRGIALGSALVRSYDPASTVVSRASCIRQLRFWRPLDGSPDLTIGGGEQSGDQVVFEITDSAILHRPDPTAPERLISSLEVFVFEAPGEIGEPTEWDTRQAWKEVFDFSESEAADKHYRVIVDDRLHSYLVLRKRLGYRVLLDDFALSRVYVRFVPAIGRAYEAKPVTIAPWVIPDDLRDLPTTPQAESSQDSDGLVALDEVTLQLDEKYFADALIRPRIKDATVSNAATWAVIGEDIGLQSGEQIAIQGAASGKTYFRTLSPGTQGRRLTWSGKPSGTNPDPVDDHSEIQDVFEAAKTSVARLSDVARGQAFPLWQAYYSQATNPDRVGKELPQFLPGSDSTVQSIPSASSGVQWPIKQFVHIPQGSTFLLLEDSSHTKAGDFLLIGRKLRAHCRQLPTQSETPQPPENKGTLSKFYNDQSPWLTAEVVQVVEVQGPLIRLKEAVSQTFVRDQGADGTWVTDVVVVPAVASVFFGDYFYQTVQLDKSRTFIFKNLSTDPHYLDVPLLKNADDDTVPGIDGAELRDTLKWSGLAPQELFDNRLFLAVGGEVKPATSETWSRTVTVQNRGLPLAYLPRLLLDDTIVTLGQPVDAGNNGCRFELDPKHAIEALHRSQDLLLAVEAPEPLPPLIWNKSATATSPPTPGLGEFDIVAVNSFKFLPAPALPSLDEKLLAAGGLLMLEWGSGNQRTYPFIWPVQSGTSFEGLEVTGVVPTFTANDAIVATAIGTKAEFSTSSEADWYIDWEVPAGFKATNWQTLARAGFLVRIDTQHQRYQPVHFTFAATPGYLSLRLPVESGHWFLPLTAVDTLWALPSDALCPVKRTNLQEVWSIPVGGYVQGASDKLLMTPKGKSSVVADVEVSGDALNIEFDPAERLTRFEILRKVDSVQKETVYGITEDEEPLILTAASTKLVCQIKTAGVTALRHAELLTVGQVPASFFVVLGSPSVAGDATFETIARYFDAPATPASFEVVPGSPTVTKVTVAIPDGWDDKTAAVLPVTDVLVVGNNQDENLLTALSVQREPPSAPVVVFTFEGTPDFADKTFYLVIDELAYDDVATVDALVNWTLPEAWLLPEGTSPVGYSTTKFDTVNVNGESATLTLLREMPSGPIVSSVPERLYGAVLNLLAIEPQPQTLVSGDLSALPAHVTAELLETIGFLIKDTGQAWQPYAVVEESLELDQADGWSLRLAETLAKVTEGVAAGAPIPFRFAYESAACASEDPPKCKPLRLDVQLPKAKLDTLGVLSTSSGANRVLFHGDGTGSAKSVAFQVIDSASGLLRLTVTEDEIRSLFHSADIDADSAPTHPLLAFVQFWNGLQLTSVKSQSWLYLGLAPIPETTGVRIELQPGDELVLTDGDGKSFHRVIDSAVAVGVYALSDADGAAQLQIAGLKAELGSQPFRSTITFNAEPDLAPYLLTCPELIDPSKKALIRDTLLRYDECTKNDDGSMTAVFDDSDVLETLFGLENPQLRLYSNQKSNLRSEFYISSIKYFERYNFLDSNDTAPSLVAKIDSTVFRGSGQTVMICDSKWSATPSANVIPNVECGIGAASSKVLQLVVISQSVVFNSGNFIPVLGTNPSEDNKVIRNALRVWVSAGDTDKTVEYDGGGVLARRLANLESNLGVYELPQEVPEGPESSASPDLYTFTKLPGGVFVLNFLLLGRDTAEVTVCAEYAAPRIVGLKPNGEYDPPIPTSPTGQSRDPSSEELDEAAYRCSRRYEFETRVETLDPKTALVLLDSGSLKAEDYLYLHTAPPVNDADAPAIPIYPTQVKEVRGPIVALDPPVPFDVDTFHRYFVTGTARPQNPASLDKGYYAWLTAVALSGPRPTVPIGTRLIIDSGIEAEGSLLRTLVPGDRLLIWDERWRAAWFAKRRSFDATINWFDFPSYQYEAVIKSVDWDTGLIVLSEPIPERFAIDFSSKDPDQDNRCDVVPEPSHLRILPRYRAPYQGRCQLLSLGSGDKSRKFARYMKSLKGQPGLASMPIESDKTYASNIEVLSLEPRSGEWNRWTQFVSIEDAQRKDRAFTLGADLAAIERAAEALPIVVSFGDGKHGQLLPAGVDNVYARVTSLGAFDAHVRARQPLRILAAWRGTAPFSVPPEAAAASVNLWLRIEAGAHLAWSPLRRSESHPSETDWRPSMLIEVGELPWYEVTQAEAQAGYDGYFVRGVRPGLVDVFFLSRQPIQACSVSAWMLPDSGVWLLDGDFYETMALSDPTRVAGARQLSLLETEGLRQGSLLAFSASGSIATELVEVATIERESWSVTLREALRRQYPLAGSYLQGNVVEVIQGRTDTYTIGSGDGTTPDLRLAIGNTAPILYAYLHAKSDPEPRIALLVNGIAWTRVDSFTDCYPRDHVWRLDVEPDTKGYVVFGDGTRGAIPPFGANNIVVRVCIGDGEAGNLAEGAIDKLIDDTLGIKQTYNLTEATGGKRGETTGQVRETLRTRQIGLERIVTAEDAPSVALEVGEILHAQLDPTAPAGRLALVVALEQRRELSEDIRKTLLERIVPLLPATADLEVSIVGAEQVPVYLAITIQVGQGQRAADVLAKAQAALSCTAPGFFAPERWPIGAPLRLGDVYEVLFSVLGVAHAQITWMSTERLSGSGPTKDFVSPGVRGVIRCDNDPTHDPRQDFGTVQFTVEGGTV